MGSENGLADLAISAAMTNFVSNAESSTARDSADFRCFNVSRENDRIRVHNPYECLPNRVYLLPAILQTVRHLQQQYYI
jgi:hypothetical protein